MAPSRLFVAAAIAALALGGCASQSTERDVIPRASLGPVIDGKLDDACWRSALVLTHFTRPKSDVLPRKPVEARVTFDDEALYIAFRCAEPDPSRMRAEITQENRDVWQDDCVQIWLRATPDASDFVQFIVSTLGTRGWHRINHGAVDESWKPAFRGKASVANGWWTTELAIPFSDLGTTAARRGDLVEMKLGRSDYASKPADHVGWPAGSRFAGPDDFVPLYFEDADVLANPTMAIGPEGAVTAWTFSKDAAGKFSCVRVGAQDVIRIDSPGGYFIAQQALRLRPNSLYRIEALGRGSCDFSIAARTSSRKGEPSMRHDFWFKPSETFKPGRVQFPTGETGEALIIIGTGEGSGKGTAELKGLRVLQDVAYDSVGPRIRLASDAPEPTVVTKLLVTDCRAVRGFISAPIDGSLESWGWDGQYYEYNRPGAQQGVGYDYRNNDGLHIKLADRLGFNEVIIRGGVRAKLYRDVPSYTGPEGGTLLADLPGRTRNTTRVWFDDPVTTDSVSFFDVCDGTISDVGFFRVRQGLGQLPGPEPWSVGGAAPANALPDRLAAHFGKEERAAYVIEPVDRPPASIQLTAGKAVHFVSAPLPKETPLAAVGLDFTLGSAQQNAAFTATVQDAVDTRRELYSADFEVDKPGHVRVVLDFPDQILPAGTRLWLTLKFEQPAHLVWPTVELYVVDRAKAAPEALAYRKLLLHGLYCAMSEARPWNGWYERKKAEAFLKSDSPYAPCVQNVLDALDHCRYIGGDDDVRQIYEWIWRGVLRREGKTPGFEAKFDAAPGAPEWACLVRQAWLQARAVPKWWIDHRLVPTGEMGGEVNDDTDMFGNYADFVMFENDGVAAELKDAAERLAELDEQTTMTDGVNRRTMDPLHAYEEGLNHEALCAFWHYGDPVYLERCMTAARSLAALTVVTPKGHRHFRSQQIGAAKRDDPRMDIDGHAHPLMWHPAFEVARYNANPMVLRWLREWADGWLEHSEPGKYAMSVEVATEKVTETSATPVPGGYGGQGSALESLYWVTGDRKYIAPFMDIYRRGRDKTEPGGMVPELDHRGAFEGVGDNVTGLLQHDPFVRAATTGDKSALCKALKYDITELQRYRSLYTTVEPFTDRVFLYAITNAAKAYTGGYETRNKFSRTHAASYEGFGTDYAALVLAATPARFKVLLYNFADRDLKGRIRLWTLQHGRYKLSVGPGENRDDRADRVDREETVEIMRATPVEVVLPSRQLTVVELTQVDRLDDERNRPDLALSPLDTRVSGGAVESVVHNIGSAGVDAVEVALVDASGKVRARKDLGPLAAPIDLVPKTIRFRFDGLPADPTGFCVVVDPDDKVKEIYEGNNRVDMTPRKK